MSRDKVAPSSLQFTATSKVSSLSLEVSLRPYYLRILSTKVFLVSFFSLCEQHPEGGSTALALKKGSLKMR